MAKGKYEVGHFYVCERCGNEVKIVTSGGGNLICCVKAMQQSPRKAEPEAAAGAPAKPGTARTPATPPPAAPAKPNSKPRPPVDVASLKPLYFYDVGQFENDKPVRKPMFQVGDQNVELICLRYGQEVPPRPYDCDQTVFVIEGRGLFTLNERKEEIATGASIVVPAGIKYGIKNTSPDDMFVMAVSVNSNH